MVVLVVGVVVVVGVLVAAAGHSASGWGITGSVLLQTVGPKSIRLGDGRPPIASRRLLLMLVTMQL